MAVEQDARAARVLAEHDVRPPQLAQDAQRDVLEVADRRRADGERHDDARRVQRLEADSPAPTSPAAEPSSRRHDADTLADRRRAPRAGRPRAPGSNSSSPAAREAAADDDELRTEDVDEAADPRAEPAADAGQRLARARVTLAAPAARARCASALGPSTSRATRVGRDARSRRLEVAAARADPLARRPVDLDHDVAELGPAAEEPAVDDEPPPTPVPSVSMTIVVATRGPRRASTRRARPRSRRSRSPTGQPKRSLEPVAEAERRASGMLTDPRATPGRAGRSATGCRRRPRRRVRRDSLATAASSASSSVVLRRDRASAARASLDAARRGRRPRPRIFVPPRSTPITRLRVHARRGYHNPPHGRRREALPRLPRRTREGQGARAAAAGARGRRATRRHGRRYRGRAPAKQRRRRLGWGRGIGARARRCSSCCSSSGRSASYLAVPQRRRGRERAARPAGARAALTPQDGLLLSTADDDPAARHRPREPADRRERAAAPTRSCSSAPTRSTASPRVPLDPARPARRRSRATAPRRSTPPSRSAGRRSPRRTVRQFTGLPINHVVDRRLRQLPRARRRARRDRRSTCPEPILSNRFDCPLRRRRVRQLAGLALRQGQAAHGRPPRAVYSRIRENQLDPAETDITRGERQQQVLAGDRATS